MSSADCFLGIDLGTSSVRCTAVNPDNEPIAVSKVDLPLPENPESGHYQQDPEIWWNATLNCINQLADEIQLSQVKAISVDGTSSTVLLTDSRNKPISPALMYNDSRSGELLGIVENVIPEDHLTRSATSSLMKSLWLLKNFYSDDAKISHQADWVLAMLTGRNNISDENNCLKLGFDSVQQKWPDWMQKLPFDLYSKLPEVYRASDFAGNITPGIGTVNGLHSETGVFFGTTDSTASTLATGVDREGQAVTTLGSTMVMKTITRAPVNNFEYGLYSHRLPDNLWLSGGASNAGGNVLLKYFSIEALEHLSQQINPDKATGLQYYPLPAPGERFPINDPKLVPRMEPRPASDSLFLSAIFEGLAGIEKLAYEKIAELGGTLPREIITSGGKAATNKTFTAIRQRILKIPVKTARYTEASYGAALLAKHGWEKLQKKAR